MAVLLSLHKRLTLDGIWAFISGRFRYYSCKFPAWQNSIPHNLSFKDCFIKIPVSQATQTRATIGTWTQPLRTCWTMQLPAHCRISSVTSCPLGHTSTPSPCLQCPPL
nr:forkhead box protein E3-like [Oryctolagus cuniculus]